MSHGDIVDLLDSLEELTAELYEVETEARAVIKDLRQKEAELKRKRAHVFRDAEKLIKNRLARHYKANRESIEFLTVQNGRSTYKGIWLTTMSDKRFSRATSEYFLGMRKTSDGSYDMLRLYEMKHTAESGKALFEISRGRLLQAWPSIEQYLPS